MPVSLDTIVPLMLHVTLKGTRPSDHRVRWVQVGGRKGFVYLGVTSGSSPVADFPSSHQSCA